MAGWQSFDPGSMKTKELYELLVACVVPRPIGWISTVSQSGIRNLAPFSFFGLGGVFPPSLIYSPGFKRGGVPKDSMRNVQETGEFVVNLVDRRLAASMGITAMEVPPEEDEWMLSGVQPAPSDIVRPERVAESPASFECKVFEIVRHGVGSAYVIGEIVRIHIRDDINFREVSPAATLPLVGRLGADDYIDLQVPEYFKLNQED